MAEVSTDSMRLGIAGKPERPKLRLGLVLNSPSGHQVDLLNALEECTDLDVFVGYAFPGNPDRPWGRPVPASLPWENIPSGNRAIVGNAIGRWLDDKDRDVWIVNSNYTALSTHIVARHLSRNSVPWGYLAEPPNPTNWPKRLVRNLVIRSLLKHTDGLASTGLEGCRRLAKYTSTTIPIESVPYYQSLDGFLRLPIPNPPVTGKPIRLVTVASLTPIKGLEYLLAACSRLPRVGWTLDIFGKGPLRSRLIRRIRKHQLPVNLCGTVPYDERWRMYSGYHCFVFSTLGDGWGMALPEALASGLPVIATDMAMSAHEFIHNGKNGFIGPAGDSQYLARAMNYYLDHPEAFETAFWRAKESVADYEPKRGARNLTRFARALFESSVTQSACG